MSLKDQMTLSAKDVLLATFFVFLIFVVGFNLSSGVTIDICGRFLEKAELHIKNSLYHHILTLTTVDAKQYYVLPIGAYASELFAHPLSLPMLGSILINSIFNILFQPVFLCIFTPQVFTNLLFLPFFLYGVVKYFCKTWLLLILFASLSFYIGGYDSAIEALVRHGMLCELIYLMVGSAGFAAWITRSS